jgi:hypothetical protein
MPATYEPIATTTLGTAATNIDFSSIPNTYTDLKIIASIISVAATTRIFLRVNGDTGSTYSSTNLYGDGTSALSMRYASTSSFLRSATGDNAKNIFWEIDIFSYAGSTHKTALGRASADNNGSGATFNSVGLWRNTAAITSLSIYSLTASNLDIGSTVTLYGIKNA